MSVPDAVNGGFEALGSVMLWLSVRRLLKDKAVKGFSISSVAFFMVWGWWNIFYYPHLGQWLSFVGGISVVIANTTWVVLAVYYKRLYFPGTRW